MLKDLYTFEELKFSSKLVRDLINEEQALEPLVSDFYNLGKIEETIQNKDYSMNTRETLVKSIRNQYQGIEISESTDQNISALSEKTTYTITTGHQLNLLTGPLYTLYKILEVISICNELNDRFTEYHFVPVFWMATEDHDFEEINHIHLFEQRLSWEKTDQQQVVVGRLKTAGMRTFLDTVKEKFKDPSAEALVKNLLTHYQNHETLAMASRSLYNELFGQYGLVIVDGDDASLKQLFQRTMQREVEEELGYEGVMKNNDYLEENGYHQQVFVRECNLFYIDKEGARHRIINDGGAFNCAGNEFNAEELSEMIADRPQDFSPNALFRPLYQETILPNLVYVGGGGEIAYWMQLSELFNLADLQMPMLRVRDSLLITNSKQSALIKELNISLMDLRIGVDQLVKDIAINEAESELQLTDAEALLFQAKSGVLEKVHKVEPGMKTMVEAEFAKMIKSIERIEGKLIKAEKQKHEKTQNQLVKLRNAFFPDGGQQERHENILMYITRHPDFIQNILTTLKAEKTPFFRTIQF
jgi:bacillithiol biosynthesis cysteine-adding enzyme BshC